MDVESSETSTHSVTADEENVVDDLEERDEIVEAVLVVSELGVDSSEISKHSVANSVEVEVRMEVLFVEDDDIWVVFVKRVDLFVFHEVVLDA